VASDAKLSPEVVKGLSTLLSHLVETQPERQELIELSFGDHSIKSGVDFEGAATTFLVNLMSYLYSFGEIDGKNALVIFAEAASEKVGDDKKEKLYLLLGQFGYERPQSQHRHVRSSKMSMTLNSSFETMTSNERRLLSLFDVGFYGTNLVNALDLVLGDDGGFDDYPDDTEAIVSLIQDCSSILFSAEANEALFEQTTSLLYWLFKHEYTSENLPSRSGSAIPIAKKIERSILNIEYKLSKKELAAFVIGQILGTWYFKDRKLSELTRIQLVNAVKILNSTDDSLISDINKQIDLFREDDFVTPDPVLVVRLLVRNLIMFLD
jgi:hypothetical protein